jgi:hypothetical protein
MGIWNTVQMDVDIEYDDFMRAHGKTLEREESPDIIRVEATVDIDEALSEATIDQLREALGREEQGYTADQLVAIRDCFEALACGDVRTAEALLPRIFDHLAQISAAESGLRTLHRRAA